MTALHFPENTRRTSFILLFFAFSLAAAFLVLFVLPLSFELQHSDDLIIGDATLHGTDINSRSRVAYRLIFIGTCMAMAFWALLRYGDKRWKLQQQNELVLIAAALACFSFLQVLGLDSRNTLTLLLLLFALRIALIAFFWGNRSSVLCQGPVFGLSNAFAILLFFGLHFMFARYPLVKDHPVACYFMLLSACLAGYGLLSGFFSLSVTRITLLLLPLCAVPFAGFITLEAFFYCHKVRHDHIPFRWLAMAMLVFACCLTYLFYRQGRTISLGKMTTRFLAPSVLFAFTLLTHYMPLMNQHTEMFELANHANPLTSVFHYGKIPLLDFISSHMLSEQWYGYLYTLIFGYNTNGEFLIYLFLNYYILLLGIFCLLNKLSRRPLLALFFTLLFPLLDEVFYMPVFLGVLPFFLSEQLLNRPTVKQFLQLFFLLLALLLWRIDTGLAAIMAAFVYFPILWLATRTTFPLRVFLKAAALFTAFVSALAGFAMLLRSPEVIAADLKKAAHYFTANQAHGYAQILNDYTHQFYILYVLLPFVAVVSCALIFLRLRNAPFKKFAPKHLHLCASLFLFLLYLANQQRGLVRHGYAERSEFIVTSTFFLALALLISDWMSNRKFTVQTAVIFLGAFFSFYLVKYFPYKPDCNMIEKAMADNAYHKIDGQLGDADLKGRIKEDTAFASTQYAPLKTFLDRHLLPHQTFLDFSNTPMLYYYCDRESPGYFSQNLQNSVDDYLQMQLLQDAEPEKAPVAVFASYPREWLDNADGVPNVVRYYLIAEYLFQHYKPYGILGTKSVWIHRSLNIPAIPAQDTLLHTAEKNDLGLLPEYTGAYYENLKHSRELQQVLVKTRQAMQSHGDSLELPLDAIALRQTHCYLALDFKKRTEPFDAYPVTIVVTDSVGTLAGSFTFIRRDKVSSRYLIRLSNHYFWYRYPSLRLTISGKDDLDQISILKDMRFENQAANHH